MGHTGSDVRLVRNQSTPIHHVPHRLQLKEPECDDEQQHGAREEREAEEIGSERRDVQRERGASAGL